MAVSSNGVPYSYLWSVLCKYPNKLLWVRLAAFSQQSRTQQLCFVLHLEETKHLFNKEFSLKKSIGDKGVMKDEIKMSNLGVGHPLITWLAWLSEAQTGAITWTTQDNKHPHKIWRKIYGKEREQNTVFNIA